MEKKLFIRKNEYHDSIQLLRVRENLRKMEGVEQLMVVMATPSNKQILENMDFLTEEARSTCVNDMIIAVKADSLERVEKVVEQVDDFFRKGESGKEEKEIHKSLDSALDSMPDANLCVISVPGEHAREQAIQALNAGLHVIVYSDNVPLHQDREIKELAEEKGLLCMGPDCGVANINGVAFLTASVVKKGPIGIAGASGSGTQLISVLTEREGLGVSQAIGVGGKDLKDEVGGISMLMAMDALENDSETEVIILVSRVPGASTQEKILERVQKLNKPVVVYFISGDNEIIKKSGATAATDLEDATLKAVKLAEGETYQPKIFTLPDEEIQAILERETSRMLPEQLYLRGLYCGGTFCDEAIAQLKSSIGDVYSNTPDREYLRLENSFESRAHTVIDLGDEEFTLGRPHPVIDPEPVRMAVLREGKKPDTAVILLDFILGPAINTDPVGSVIEQIREVKKARENAGGYLSVIASICGTEGDPQNLSKQTKMLEDAGVVVMPSNAQAARLAGKIAKISSEKIQKSVNKT
jgi:FdrA protein